MAEMPPRSRRATGRPRGGDRLDLLLFAIETVLIVALTGALQRARDAAERASREDRLVGIVSHDSR